MKKISKILSIILSITLIFSVVLVPSASAEGEVYLTDLVFDGYTVPGFDANTTKNYTGLTLPWRDGVTTPEVTATVAEGCTYDVETTADTVTVTVKKDGETVETYTLNYSVIGENKLINPSFEDRSENGSYSAPWMLLSGPYVRDAAAHSGTRSLTWGGSGIKFMQYVDVPANWYALNAGWARGPHGATGDAIPAFYMDGGNATPVGGKNLAQATDVGQTYVHAIQAWEMKNVNTGAELTELRTCIVTDLDTPQIFADDFFAGVLVAGDLQIGGAPSGTITAANDIQLSATVVNQLGTTDGILEQPSVSWRLVKAPAGVELENGKVTFDPALDTVGDIVVEATAAPNWGPAEQQAAQTIIGNRVTMTANIESNIPKAALSEIVFDGYSVPNFNAQQYAYNLTLPYRDYVPEAERYIPTVSATAANGATCVVGTPVYNSAAKTGTVTITAQQSGLRDGVYTLTYKVIGENLVMNPGFENESDHNAGWMRANGSVVRAYDSGAHSGSYSMLSSEANSMYYQDVEVPEKWYCLTAGWARGAYGATGEDIPSFYMGGLRMTQIGEQNVVKATDVGQTYVHPIQAWEMINFLDKTPISTLRVRVASDSTGTAYFDDFYAGVLVAGDLQITAPETITSAGITDLNAQVVNQLRTTDGIKVQPSVSWRVVEAPAGVSINASTGELTIPEVCVGDIIVEATAAPNWGPAEQQAAQTIIGNRVEIEAKVAPAEVTFSANGNIVTPTVKWFNDSLVSKIVRVYTAIFVTVDGAEILDNVVISDEVTVESGAIYEAELVPVTVPDSCTVKSFVLTDCLAPVMENAFYNHNK